MQNAIQIKNAKNRERYNFIINKNIFMHFIYYFIYLYLFIHAML